MIRGTVLGFTMTSILLVVIYLAVIALSPEPTIRYFGRYTSYEHPANWQCWREARESVCAPSDDEEKRTAMIIATSSPLQDSDSLESFEDHLRTPRSVVDASGHSYRSEVLSVERRKINGKTWILGSQMGSEVPDYETHYFATIHRTVAILIAFSLHSEAGSHHRDAADFWQGRSRRSRVGCFANNNA